MNRLKNYGLWIAVIAYIPLVVDALSSYDILVKLPDNYELLAKGLMVILGLVGIINNPDTVNRGFLDDKQDE